MTFMPILPKDKRIGPALSAEGFAGPLPTFYMNDYSVMGLRVSDCDRALGLLEASPYPVARRRGCRGVGIRSAAQIEAVIALLAQNGLDCELTDIAEQIYQG